MCFSTQKTHPRSEIGHVSKCASPTKIWRAFSNMNSFPVVVFCFLLPKIQPPFFGGRYLFFKLFPLFWPKEGTTKITKTKPTSANNNICFRPHFSVPHGVFFPVFAKGTEGHQARSLAIHPTGAAATSLHPDETYEAAGGGW